MIEIKTKKNGKKVVTSSYFEDIKMLEESIKETKSANYIKRWEKTAQNKQRNLSSLELSNVVMRMTLAKKGLAELSEFADKLSKKEYENYEFKYGPCKDYETYEDLLAEYDELDHAQEKDYEAIAECEKKIAAWDKHLELSIDRVENPEKYPDIA